MEKKNKEEVIKIISDIKTDLNTIKAIMQKKDKEKILMTYKPSSKKDIFIISLFILILLLTEFVFFNYCKNCEKRSDIHCVDVQVISQQVMPMHASENTTSTINSIMETRFKSRLGLINVLMISYIVVFVITVSLICYLIATDDGGIKFAKLNELRDLRINTLKSMSVPNNLQDYETIEENQNNKKAKKDIRTITKKKNLNAELIKNYMNSITEI